MLVVAKRKIDTSFMHKIKKNISVLFRVLFLFCVIIVFGMPPHSSNNREFNVFWSHLTKVNRLALFQILHRCRWVTVRGRDVFKQSVLSDGAQRLGHERWSTCQLCQPGVQHLLAPWADSLGRQCQTEVRYSALHFLSSSVNTGWGKSIDTL